MNVWDGSWMRIESFIYAKKILFVSSVVTLDAYSMYLEVFKSRKNQISNDIPKYNTNTLNVECSRIYLVCHIK